MQVEDWLTAAAADARRRGLEGLPPLLETLARSTRALRAADHSSRAQAEADPASSDRARTQDGS